MFDLTTHYLASIANINMWLNDSVKLFYTESTSKLISKIKVWEYFIHSFIFISCFLALHVHCAWAIFIFVLNKLLTFHLRYLFRQFIGSLLLVHNEDSRNEVDASVLLGFHLTFNISLQLKNVPPNPHVQPMQVVLHPLLYYVFSGPRWTEHDALT